MRLIFTTLLFILSFSTNAQLIGNDSLKLTVSPLINRELSSNKKIITTLSTFLNVKNNPSIGNKFWLGSDFDKYTFPYWVDLDRIEMSKYGNFFYQPSLMEIIPTEDQDKWIIKIAFVGHNQNSGENLIKAIYNLIAQEQDGEILFSRYLNEATKNWKEIKVGSITYKISPLREPNQDEIELQLSDIKKICNFFNTEPIDITYYSCVTLVEFFQIKGFDYNPLAYMHESGGKAVYPNTLLSAKNSEEYTHEIVHIYTMKLFPQKNVLLDEGLATLMGGSGNFNYLWHRNKLKSFLEKNIDFKIQDHIYDYLYFEKETSIPNMISALISERTLRLYGKEKLFELWRTKADFWTLLEIVGLTKENINQELRKEIMLTPKDPIW